MAPPKNPHGTADTRQDMPRVGSEPARGRGRGRGRGGRTNRSQNDNTPRESQLNNPTHTATDGTGAPSPTLIPAPTALPPPRRSNRKRSPPDSDEDQPARQRARVTRSNSNHLPSRLQSTTSERNRNNQSIADPIPEGAERPETRRRPVTTRSQSNNLPSPFEVVSLGGNSNPRRGILQTDSNASGLSGWRTLRPRRTQTPTSDEGPSRGNLDSRAPSETGLIRSGSTPRRDPAFIKKPRAPRSGCWVRSTTYISTPESDEVKTSASQGEHSAANMSRGADVPIENAEVLNRYHERYEQLKLVRDKQRTKAIGEGSMTDPTQRTSLKQAITPVGTCTAMCPEFERIERIVQKMVDRCEKFVHPITGESQNLETKMIKRFRRSAAGYDEQLPSDIRTPETLLQTLNYILRNVIGGDEPLGLVHKFVWDRTRSIRNDLSIQQLTEEKDVRIAVKCLERIARFHILSLHLLVSPANKEPFSAHQDREQLNNTLLSLLHFYDDNRGRIVFENEDEFRSYYIVFSIQDQRPDLEARIQRWPSELRSGPQVQVALELFAAAGNTWEYQGTLDAKRPNAIAQGFYSRFFQIVDSDSVSYLLACVAEIYFNNVRQTAIRSIWKAYRRHPASKNEEWTLDAIRDALYFDTDEEVREFCERQLLVLSENSEGKEYLNWGKRDPDSTDVPPSSTQAYSGEYVEPKRCGRSLVAVILGKSVAQAAQSGMIVPALLAEPLPSQLRAKAEKEGPGGSLFVSDDEERVDSAEESGECQMDGQMPAEVVHRPGDAESGLLSLKPTDHQDDYFQNLEGGANMLTMPDDKTASREPQMGASMPADSSNTVPSQSRATPTGSTDRRIGPFLVSPSPSPPTSPQPAPTEKKLETAVVPGGFGAPSAPPSLGFPEPAGPPTAPTPNPFGPSATARPDGQEVAPAGTQQSTSDAAAPTEPMPVAAPVAGSVLQFENREPSETSAPPFAAPATSALQTTAFGSTMQVPGPASVAPNVGMFGGVPQWTETQSVGNLLGSGGMSEPSSTVNYQRKQIFNQATIDTVTPDVPGAQAQFSTPAAGPFFAKQMQNAPGAFTATQPLVEPAVPNYFNPNGEQFEEHPEAQASATPADSTVVMQSNTYDQEPAWMSTQANDVDLGVESSLTAPPPMPSSGWVGEEQGSPVVQEATAPPTGTTLADEPAPKEASTANEETSKDDSTSSGEKSEAGLSEPPSVAHEHTAAPKSPTVEPEPEAAAPPVATTDEAPPAESGSWLSSERVNRHGWREFLIQVAHERREAYQQEVAQSRKRTLEREEEEATTGSRKAARVSWEQVSRAVPGPLADLLASPVVPEKAVVKPPPPAAPVVDQDELLLSAARVTADALASGTHLWRNAPASRPPLRPVPVPTAESASRSVPPIGRSRISVNGYEVALAPESPLGLGRTLSRTEQRIRRTGARGFASRPFS